MGQVSEKEKETRENHQKYAAKKEDYKPSYYSL
jgi:hypothetical protein